MARHYHAINNDFYWLLCIKYEVQQHRINQSVLLFSFYFGCHMPLREKYMGKKWATCSQVWITAGWKIWNIQHCQNADRRASDWLELCYFLAVSFLELVHSEPGRGYYEWPLPQLQTAIQEPLDHHRIRRQPRRIPHAVAKKIRRPNPGTRRQHSQRSQTISSHPGKTTDNPRSHLRFKRRCRPNRRRPFIHWKIVNLISIRLINHLCGI